MKATLFDIQRFSVHDGPGIRTTVFFKGCNLRCRWCHNPESIDPKLEIQHYPEKCIGCGECIAVCPSGALSGDDRTFNRGLCKRCGECTKVCYAGALERVGYEKTVDEILSVVMSDMPFYAKSGGGMTCSGGEPLLQAGFLEELLKAAKEKGLHTAVDTAGNVPFAGFESILPYTDLFLYDLKAADEVLHREMTGVGNMRILQNLKLLASKDTGARIWIRVPCIPEVLGKPPEMERLADVISSTLGGSNCVELIELLNYHGLGGGKYESLGKGYMMGDSAPLSKEIMETLGKIIMRTGFPVKIS